MLTILGKNKHFSSSILHQIEDGENLKNKKKRYNISVELLKHKNSEIYAGNAILIEGVDKKYHIVKPAETIDSIAKKYNISPQEIMEKNNTTKLFVGQLLEL